MSLGAPHQWSILVMPLGFIVTETAAEIRAKHHKDNNSSGNPLKNMIK